MVPQSTARLSDFEKGKVIVFHELELSHIAIDKRIKWPRGTVQPFQERHEERGHHKNLSTPVRKKLIDKRLKRRVIRHTRTGRRQPFAELRNVVAPEVSVRTVKRTLHE